MNTNLSIFLLQLSCVCSNFTIAQIHQLLARHSYDKRLDRNGIEALNLMIIYFAAGHNRKTDCTVPQKKKLVFLKDSDGSF